MNEEEKGKIESKVFKEFAEKAKILVEPGSIMKEFPPYPDISCDIVERGKVWFELTEVCSPDFHKAIFDLENNIKNTEKLNSPVPEVPRVWGNDVSAQTVLNKIKKKYPIDGQVELLVYTNAMTAMTDEILKSHIEPVLVDDVGQFTKIWLMGDNVHLLWPVID
jgi:hypothetical protein